MIEILLAPIIPNLIFFISYLKLNKKNYLNFINYFIFFIAYSFFLILLMYFFGNNLAKNFNGELTSFFILYFLFFLSFFLTASPRYIKSPTYLIFKKLNSKKKCSLNDFFNYFKKEKVLSLRFKDLKKQNLIEYNKKKIKLKKDLGIVIYIIFFIKKFYKLKSEG